MPLFAMLTQRAAAVFGEMALAEPLVADLLQMQTMFEERIVEIRERMEEQFWQEWLQAGLQEGRQVGLQEGRLEGQRAGEARILTRQLERRFGPLPESARQRITNADVSTLEDWGLRLLDAGSLDDVFACPKSLLRQASGTSSNRQLP